MLDFINKYKIVPFAIVWGLGVLYGYFSLSFNIVLYLMIISILVSGWMFFAKKYHFAYLFLLIVFFSLSSLYNLFYFYNKFSPIENAENYDVLLAKIKDIELTKSSKNQLLTVETYQIFDENRAIKLKRNILVKSFDVINNLKIGNIAKFYGKLKIPLENKIPGFFDKKLYLNSNGIFAEFYADSINVVDSSYNLFYNNVYLARKSLFEYFDKNFNLTTSSILKALFLSYKQELNYDVKQDFVNTGTVHVLAVSGLHVGYVLAILTIIFSFIPFGVRNYFIIAGLILFMLISGSAPSVQRSTIMAILYLIAKQYLRSTNLLNSLFLAFFIILLISPYEIINAGFQLSFLAVLSIGLFLPIFNDYIYQLKIKNSIINYLLMYLALTISVQLLVLPLVMMYFSKISIIGIVANLIVVPFIGIIVASGFLVVLLSFLPVVLLSPIIIFIEFVVNLVLILNNYLANFPYSYIKVSSLGINNLIFYYISIMIFYFVIKFKNRLVRYYALVLTIVMIFLSLKLRFSFSPQYKFILDNIYNKNYISSLVNCNNNILVICEGKPTNNESYNFLNLLRYYDISKIDYLIILNPNEQNVDFVNDIGKNVKIKKIYIPDLDKIEGKNLRKVVDFEIINKNGLYIILKNFNNNLSLNLIYNNKSFGWGFKDKDKKSLLLDYNFDNDKKSLDYEKLVLQ